MLKLFSVNTTRQVVVVRSEETLTGAWLSVYEALSHSQPVMMLSNISTTWVALQ